MRHPSTKHKNVACGETKRKKIVRVSYFEVNKFAYSCLITCLPILRCVSGSATLLTASESRSRLSASAQVTVSLGGWSTEASLAPNQSERLRKTAVAVLIHFMLASPAVKL